jgi:hypothetical protein
MYWTTKRAATPPKWEVPPWELPGNFRLDCAPHHGPLLRWLANIALVFVCGSFVLLVTAPVFYMLSGSLFGAWLPFLLAPLGGMIGLAAWLPARRELVGMNAGRIDPSGQWEARFARDRGRAMFVLSLFFPLLYALLLATA